MADAAFTNTGHPYYARPPNGTRVLIAGDLHGDLGVMLALLHSVAGVVDDRLRWKPGERTWLVLCGDMVDRVRPGQTPIDPETGRGPGEIRNEEIIMQLLLNDLDRQAKPHGGRVLKLIGNHEVMGLLSPPHGAHAYAGPTANRSRGAGGLPLAPGSLLARLLMSPGNSGAALQVGPFLCVHGGVGGVRPAALGRLLPKLNAGARRLFRGEAPGDADEEEAVQALLLDDRRGVLWDRTFGFGACGDARLDAALGAVNAGPGAPKENARYLAVGHSTQMWNAAAAKVFTGEPQPHAGKAGVPRAQRVGPPLQTVEGAKGISCGCGGRVWRVDVAQSRAFDGADQALPDPRPVPDERLPQVLDATGGRPRAVLRLKPGAWAPGDRARKSLPPWLSSADLLAAAARAVDSMGEV